MDIPLHALPNEFIGHVPGVRLVDEPDLVVSRQKAYRIVQEIAPQQLPYFRKTTVGSFLLRKTTGDVSQTMPWIISPLTREVVRNVLTRRGKMYSLFLFDLHNTLVVSKVSTADLLYRAFVRLLKKAGSTFRATKDDYKRTDRFFRDSIRRGMSAGFSWMPVDEFWRSVNRSIIESFADPPPSREETDRIAAQIRAETVGDPAIWHVPRGIQGVLEECRRHTVALGILSNSEFAIVKRTIVATGLDRYFEDALIFTPDRMLNIQRPHPFSFIGPVIGARYADVRREIGHLVEVAKALAPARLDKNSARCKARFEKFLKEAEEDPLAGHPYDRAVAVSLLASLLKAGAPGEYLNNVGKLFEYCTNRAMQIGYILWETGYIESAHDASVVAEMSFTASDLLMRKPLLRKQRMMIASLRRWYENFWTAFHELLPACESVLPNFAPQQLPIDGGEDRLKRFEEVFGGKKIKLSTLPRFSAYLTARFFVWVGVPRGVVAHTFELAHAELLAHAEKTLSLLMSFGLITTDRALHHFAYLSTTLAHARKRWGSTGFMSD